MSLQPQPSSPLPPHSTAPRPAPAPPILLLQPAARPPASGVARKQSKRARRLAQLAQPLCPELFRNALDREFARVERFDEPFALLIISSEDDGSASCWPEVVEVVNGTRLETDILGWLVADKSIGVIRPLANIDPADAATTLAVTVQRELARVLGREGAMSCSIRLEVCCHRGNPAALAPSLETALTRLRAATAEASKRTLDIAGSLALLTLLAPVFLLVSGLIRLSSEGPVLFRQVRVGRNGRPFTMFKFRTMRVNCDPAIHEQYVAQFIQAGASADAGAKVFKIVNDPRITPVGHFLRRSSLDELPQFWNVLLGDMSLVGPRPSLPYEVARYKRWHKRRLSEAKPGITGLWQVTARSRTTFDEMVRLDLQYARQSSLWTDIRILLATPRAVFSGRGAH